MEIRQIRVGAMANFVHVVADPETGDAILIDPAFEVDRILASVAHEGWRVTGIVNTHGHPDHVAGNRKAIARTHAPLYLHEADLPLLNSFFGNLFVRVLGGKPSGPPDKGLSDGDAIPVGRFSLQVIHTPGHTPGSICLYSEGQLFTGDTLFVGYVGRTDLKGGDAETLNRSIRDQLFVLPEETVVWPGHDYGNAPTSTIGQEKATNPLA